VILLNLATGFPSRTLHHGNISALAVSADEYMLAIVSREGVFSVFDLATLDLIYRDQAHQDSIVDVAVSRNGDRIVTASNDGTIKIQDLDMETGAPEFILVDQINATGVTKILLTRERNPLFVCATEKTLKLYDPGLGHTEILYSFDSMITQLKISEDNRYIILGDTSGQVTFFEWIH